jgi:hypothetical protein
MHLKTWSILALAIIILTIFFIATFGFSIYNQAIAQSLPNSNMSSTGANNSTISSIIENNYADLVLVDYDGNNRVILTFYETESRYGWEAIDLLEDSYGYKLDSVLSSGMGSVGNPTRFFAVLSK